MSRGVPRLLRWLAPQGRRLLLAVLASVGGECAAVALMGTAAWLITRAAQQPPLAAVAVAVVAVRALALGRGLLRYGDRLLGHDAVLRAVAGVRARVFEALVPLAPGGTAAFRSGDLLTRLVDDVDAVQDLLLRVLMPATTALVVAGGTTGVVLALLPGAGLVLGPALAAAALLVPCLVYTRTGRDGDAAKEARAELAAVSVDLTRGAADLAACGAERRVRAQAAHAAGRLAALERREALTTGLGTAAVLLLQAAATVGVTAAALRAHAAGELTAPRLTVLAVLALVAFEPVAGLPAAARRLAEVRAGARRLAAVLDAPPPVAEPAHPAPFPHGRPLALEISGLRVRHDQARPPALDGLSLRLPPGRRVGLAGPSGAGKSTLLAVLMRFVDYEAGSVRLGGRELREYDGADVRRAVAGMTQDAHVFRATLRANLLLARPGATEDQLREAARRARLLEWIESLPDGWETVPGEGGTTLSGGQRRRLLLARALLADPPVLVLDEPTEGLDPETAAGVLADVLAATRGRTLLLVTHAPEALSSMDETVRLS